MTKPNSILFVCLGNIVRSPLAEHIFRKSAEAIPDLGGIEVSSGGTSSYHLGESPDIRMRRTAANHGIFYNGRAKQVTPQDLGRYDLIIAMDQSNYTDLKSMMNSSAGTGKLRMLREFDPQGGPYLGVPDPYYGGHDGFEETFHIVDRSINGLIRAIQHDQL